jgi:stearoyl-CoA desaturase (Delta-9 desaturase)
MYHPRYCATRGLLFSHIGWFFIKPKYPKLHLIERDSEDLEEDPGESTRRGLASRDKSPDRVPHAQSSGYSINILVSQLYQTYAGSNIGCIVPLSIAYGLVFPAILGAAFGDTVGGFIYGALVARLLSAY